MGRIAANVTITNLLDKKAHINCDALVDTGAAYMVLPTAWKKDSATSILFAKWIVKPRLKNSCREKYAALSKSKSKVLSRSIRKSFFSKWNRRMAFMSR